MTKPQIEGIEFSHHGLRPPETGYDEHHYQAIVICKDDTKISIIYCDPEACTYSQRFLWDKQAKRGCFYNHDGTYEALDYSDEDGPTGYLTPTEVIQMILNHGGLERQQDPN